MSLNTGLIEQIKLVSIVRSSFSEGLEETVESLYNGGIRAVEITMNTPGALSGIERAKEIYPDMFVGAGTVLDSETARLAILAGANFLLAPTLDKGTIKTANRYQVPIIPGVMTPTEALNAYEWGAEIVKIFPAGRLGPGYFSDLKGPLPQIQTMAVGGITLENAADYLRAGANSLGIGSALVDEKLVREGKFDEIKKRAKQFVQILNEFDL